MYANDIFAKKTIISQPYNIIVAPTTLVISLAEVKEHLRLDAADASQDNFLTGLIKTATLFAEKYTKRTFLDTTFETFLSNFCNLIELRRSKAHTINSFQYLVDSVLTTVSTDVYYLTDENDYSHILLVDGKTYPTDIDIHAQAIRIEFIAGYGVTATSVADELKTALLNHVAYMYENRGDCSKAASIFVPSLSKGIYDQFKIEDIGNGAMCC